MRNEREKVRERIRRREWSGVFEAGRETQDMRTPTATGSGPTNQPPVEEQGPTCQRQVLFTYRVSA
jgi:hypothetical protein